VKIALLSAGLFLGLALIPAIGGMPGFDPSGASAPRWAAAPVQEPEPQRQCVRYLRKVQTLRGERARMSSVCGDEIAAATAAADRGPSTPPMRPRD
jgi:hypothetical protein